MRNVEYQNRLTPPSLVGLQNNAAKRFWTISMLHQLENHSRCFRNRVEGAPQNACRSASFEFRTTSPLHSLHPHTHDLLLVNTGKKHGRDRLRRRGRLLKTGRKYAKQKLRSEYAPMKVRSYFVPYRQLTTKDIPGRTDGENELRALTFSTLPLKTNSCAFHGFTRQNARPTA